jgi:hypothetical protein
MSGSDEAAPSPALGALHLSHASKDFIAGARFATKLMISRSAASC